MGGLVGIGELTGMGTLPDMQMHAPQQNDMYQQMTMQMQSQPPGAMPEVPSLPQPGPPPPKTRGKGRSSRSSKAANGSSAQLRQPGPHEQNPYGQQIPAGYADPRMPGHPSAARGFHSYGSSAPPYSYVGGYPQQGYAQPHPQQYMAQNQYRSQTPYVHSGMPGSQWQSHGMVQEPFGYRPHTGNPAGGVHYGQQHSMHPAVVSRMAPPGGMQTASQSPVRPPVGSEVLGTAGYSHYGPGSQGAGGSMSATDFPYPSQQSSSQYQQQYPGSYTPRGMPMGQQGMYYQQQQQYQSLSQPSSTQVFPNPNNPQNQHNMYIPNQNQMFVAPQQQPQRSATPVQQHLPAQLVGNQSPQQSVNPMTPQRPPAPSTMSPIPRAVSGEQPGTPLSARQSPSLRPSRTPHMSPMPSSVAGSEPVNPQPLPAVTTGLPRQTNHSVSFPAPGQAMNGSGSLSEPQQVQHPPVPHQAPPPSSFASHSIKENQKSSNQGDQTNVALPQISHPTPPGPVGPQVYEHPTPPTSAGRYTVMPPSAPHVSTHQQYPAVSSFYTGNGNGVPPTPTMPSTAMSGGSDGYLRAALQGQSMKQQANAEEPGNNYYFTKQVSIYLAFFRFRPFEIPEQISLSSIFRVAFFQSKAVVFFILL